MKFKNNVLWGVTPTSLRIASVMISFSTWATRRGQRQFFLQDHKEGLFVASPEILVTRHTSLVEPQRSLILAMLQLVCGWCPGEPEHTHCDFGLNSAESLLVCGLMAIMVASVVFCRSEFFVLRSFISIIIANVLHDRHICKHPQRTEGIDSTLS